ncbi:MFS transporter [Streptomyces sp. NPDC050145]|uniref:MFS transporter n=1 Tax=Streptomyces sp. NPDC050145 TaxID=3365602 RepID=UPI00378E32F6
MFDHAQGTGAVARSKGERLRVPGLLLASVAAFYVIAPVLDAAAAPLVRADLGLGPEHEAVARVVGVSVTLLTLVAAGRACDVAGRRRVLLRALAVLSAACALLAVSFSGWVYVPARIVMAAALAAVFVACLACLAGVYMPGRVRRVTGCWLAAMSAGFVVAVNVAPRLLSLAGWRPAMAALAVAATGALLLVRHRLPDDGRPEARGPLNDPVTTGCWAVAGALAAAGLQLAPLWGWADPRVGGVLGAAVVVGVGARLRALTRNGRTSLPARLGVPVLVAGVTLGFTQTVLAVAVPTLMIASGGSPAAGALALSLFGAGGAAGSLLVVRRRALSPVAGCSLGLPLAAIGLALLHTLLSHGGASLLSGCVVVAVIGFGIMLALAPRMAGFLTAVPHTDLGGTIALLPGAILFGAAAAQTMPYSVGAAPAEAADTAGQMLWIATIVVAAASLLLGRPVVALVVASTSVLQYLVAKAQTDQSVEMLVALGVGAAAGGIAWSRGRLTERLTRSQETAGALLRAVLHPIPGTLGRLRLAGLYEPATADTGIGGDFLEALHTPYGTRVLIGDVRGKGLQAVQTVTDLLGCFRSQAYETEDLGELAARLDRQVLRAAEARGDEELFATALLIQHGAGTPHLEVINCGHPGPVAVGRSRAEEIEGPVHLPLGFGTLGAVDAHRVSLDDTTTLVAYTDGLSEARNASGEFYPLIDRLADGADGPPDALVGRLADEVRNWTHHLGDDIAIVALTPAA